MIGKVKRGWVWATGAVAGVMAALWMMANVAFAATPGGLTPVDGLNPTAPTGNPNSIFEVIGSALNDIVDVAAVVAGAWILFSLYRATVLFMHGSHNSQKREEAKTQIIHVAIGAIIVGAAKLLAMGLLSFASQLTH